MNAHDALEALSRKPKWWLWTVALTLLLVIGVIDYATPWQFSLFMFYAFLIFGVAGTMGMRAAILFAAGCVLSSWVSNLAAYPIKTWQGYVWSAANRSVGFLFVAACGAAIRSYREEARARVEALERAWQLEQEIVRTSENEQMRIGQDLHDGVCQSLSAIDCATECLRQKIEAEGGAHAEEAEVIQKMIRQTNVELRNIARSISPVRLTGVGLRGALETLITTTYQLRSIAITLRAEEDISVIDPTVATHLYRITQEALSNATRHAGATQVQVSLRVEEGTLTLTIADNGCGLPSDAADSAGMGLHTMQYRAHLIGATFHAENDKNGGLSVRLTLPLEQDGPWEGERGALPVPEAGERLAAGA